ncbi:hypothetical protein I7I48_01565 [Histoplasma ohiense]|nr:hypothetical protein I7I48_01565 [Histoplasma ohiense (nom. inval.)]
MSNASSATPARHCRVKRAFGSRKLCRQSPATAEYSYVALALDAAVGLLSSRAVKDAMARITRLFDEYLPSHLQLFRDISDAGIARSIDRFMNIMQIQTQLIIIDGNLTDPGNPACHHRQMWTGNFDPLAHKILLNKEVSYSPERV